MRGRYGQRWWLPALALALAWLLPLAAHARSAEHKMIVGKISGTPMGTWMTVATGGTGMGSTVQVDVANAKITEKGKSLKRYSLANGMKVRVRGAMRGTAFAAESVEILERAPKSQSRGKK